MFCSVDSIIALTLASFSRARRALSLSPGSRTRPPLRLNKLTLFYFTTHLLYYRYRLELDDSPTFTDLDFVREYDVPGADRGASSRAKNGAELPHVAQLVQGGPEGADLRGGGLGDMKNRTLYRLDAPDLPLADILKSRCHSGILNT